MQMVEEVAGSGMVNPVDSPEGQRTSIAREEPTIAPSPK
jgi:hypothetical protein